MSDKETLLEARNLAKHYPVSQGWLKPKAIARALDGVSFALHPGKTLAVVGESGCGKSTLARQVAMIEQPTAGELLIGGADVARADKAVLKRVRTLVQMVFQNPYASLNPRKKVSAMLEEPLVVNTSLTKAERAEKAQAMLARVGLRPEHYSRYPHMFSGGQRQRIAIARALMLDPKVVVADEPVSALDVSIQAQVLNLLMDLQQETGASYLFISHNLPLARRVSHRVAVMYLGQVVELADRTALASGFAHPYSRALFEAAPVPDPARARNRAPPPVGEPPSPVDLPVGCRYQARCAHRRDVCVSTPPPLRPVADRLVRCHRVEEIGLSSPMQPRCRT